jgi:hypothetical protein
LVIFLASDRRDQPQAEATVRRPKLRREIAEPFHLLKLVGLTTLAASPPCTPRKHRHDLSRLEAIMQHHFQSALQNTVAPAAPPLRTWKRSMASFTFLRSPRRSGHRRVITVIWKPL